MTYYWVQYEKDFPIWDVALKDPIKNAMDYIFTKFWDWKYEEEFRLVSYQHVGAVVSLLPECFTSLTLGVDVSRRNEQWAIEKFKKIDRNMPIYKARLSDNKHFAVDRDLIV